MITQFGNQKDLVDLEYRHGIVNSQIEIDLPLQIRALRKRKGWTQPELASRVEMKQPRISAMEKMGGAHFTLETLRRLAKAFDVALVVHFAPFSELLDWSERFKPDDFEIPAFDEELAKENLGSMGSQPINIRMAAENSPASGRTGVTNQIAIVQKQIATGIERQGPFSELVTSTRQAARPAANIQASSGEAALGGVRPSKVVRIEKYNRQKHGKPRLRATRRLRHG